MDNYQYEKLMNKTAAIGLFSIALMFVIGLPISLLITSWIPIIIFAIPAGICAALLFLGVAFGYWYDY